MRHTGPRADQTQKHGANCSAPNMLSHTQPKPRIKTKERADPTNAAMCEASIRALSRQWATAYMMPHAPPISRLKAACAAGVAFDEPHHLLSQGRDCLLSELVL